MGERSRKQPEQELASQAGAVATQVGEGEGIRGFVPLGRNPIFPVPPVWFALFPNSQAGLPYSAAWIHGRALANDGAGILLLHATREAKRNAAQLLVVCLATKGVDKGVKGHQNSYMHSYPKYYPFAHMKDAKGRTLDPYNGYKPFGAASAPAPAPAPAPEKKKQTKKKKSSSSSSKKSSDEGSKKDQAKDTRTVVETESKSDQIDDGAG